jgi:hypothetical protein
MVDVVIKVLEPAETHDLISLEDCKILLDIPEGDTSGDSQLEMLISQNSEAIAVECNRVFAKEKVEETWRCVAPVCCPDGTCKIWLSHYPVKPKDIESVESPRGSLIDPTGYDLEPLSGKLILLNGCSSEIVVTYTGGYDLPEEAPLALQQVTGMRVRGVQAELRIATTSGSGVRMLAHKDSRVIYFSPKDLVMAGGGAASPAAQSASKNVLSKYTRYFI